MIEATYWIVTKRDSPTLADALTAMGSLVLETDMQRAERTLALMMSKESAASWIVLPCHVRIDVPEGLKGDK